VREELTQQARKELIEKIMEEVNVKEEPMEEDSTGATYLLLRNPVGRKYPNSVQVIVQSTLWHGPL
jgi:hypothetical protein